MKNARIPSFIPWTLMTMVGLLTVISVSGAAYAGAGEHWIAGSNLGPEAKAAIPVDMVLVPAGKVVLGLSADKAAELSGGQKTALDVFARSVPEHTVEVGAFLCDKYEVTNAQWAIFLKSTGRQPSEYLVNFAWNGKPTYPDGEADYPVRNVTLREAKEFARWCGKRIPTEEEWMRAARGDDDRNYAWGNDWNRGKNCTNKRSSLSAVGSYPAGVSPYGIFDMTGSVWEWTVTKFTDYPNFKSPTIKIGKKDVAAEPNFNAQEYVIKGGHYLSGELPNLLAVREATLPSNNLDSLGFRCVRDVEPGMTLYRYAMDDLEGSSTSDFKCDLSRIYSVELMQTTDKEPKSATSYDCLMIVPSEKIESTVAKITKDSTDKPQPIGLILVNRPLEEPNLPAGSYVIAYRQNGLSEADRKRSEKTQEAKKRQEQIKKAEEELKKKAEERERLKKERGITASKDEIDADKEELKKLDQVKKDNAQIEADEAARQAELERMGLVSGAKEHIDFPRDKNLIVFMNANDTIVGYVEITKTVNEVDDVSTSVTHAADTKLTHVKLDLGILPARAASFEFNIKIKDNPF